MVNGQLIALQRTDQLRQLCPLANGLWYVPWCTAIVQEALQLCSHEHFNFIEQDEPYISYMAFSFAVAGRRCMTSSKVYASL